MTSAKQEFNDFLEQQKAESYTLGDITGTADGDMLKYTELKIAANQEKTKIQKLNEAKNKAFKELRAKHDQEKIALGQEWQTYEDNDYQIPE